MPIELPSGARWLREHWDGLREWNFQWVAATEDGLVTADRELARVIARVVERGIAERAVYAFVDFEEVENAPQ